MFDNLVTYHIHKKRPLAANNALAYQYLLAGNGVFIRADTRFFAAMLPVSNCIVRGLLPLETRFDLYVPRIPAHLLDTVLADACSARRPDGGFNEVLYQFHHDGHFIRVKKPAQKGTAKAVAATTMDEAAILCDLHSHGKMPAFFSQTDNADEGGARLYAVIGKVDTEPEMLLRVGVYGYWMSLPITAVFTDTGPFKDLYQKGSQSDGTIEN